MSNREICDKDIHNQIETALLEDPKRIGDIYRLWGDYEGNYERIRDELGLEGTAGISAYLNYIDAIFRDFSTKSAGKALQTKRQLVSFLGRHEKRFEEKTKEYMRDAIKFYEEISREENLLTKEAESSNSKFAEIAELEKIYVYSFPHYVDRPHIEAQDGLSGERYMLKIGRTKNDAEKRIFQQTTGMPESPVLYYVFSLGVSGYSLVEAEKKIHEHLTAIEWAYCGAATTEGDWAY